MNHVQVNRRYPSCYSEETCKDESVQLTATTESSTADGKPSILKNDSSDSGPSWEAQEVLFLDDSFCQSDCSKLTSEHGSSRYTDHDSSHFNGSDRSKSKRGNVTDHMYDDSFCQQYEKDTWWTDGLSESDDESLKSKDDNFFIPITRRGRSMTIDTAPQRGRSLDVSIQKKSHSFHRVSRRSSDTSNMIDFVSDNKQQKNNAILHPKALSSHSKRRSSNRDSHSKHRDGRHRRRSASDLSDVQKSSAKSKICTHSHGLEARHSLAILQTELHADDANKRRAPRQRSVEREHRRRSSSIQKYDLSCEKKMIQRNSYILSTSEHEIEKFSFHESTGSELEHHRRKGITTKKNTHPLTARLLADRAIARQNPNGKLLHHLDDRQRYPEENYQQHESQIRCSKGGKPTNLHPLTSRLSEGRNVGQQKHPEAPTRQSSLSKVSPSQVVRVNEVAEGHPAAWRPNLARQSSCPESPSRRAKTLQNLLPHSSSSADKMRGSLQIDERRRRLEKQHSCPESPSRRPRFSQQISHQQNPRQMERKQSGNDLKGSCTGHGGPPGKNESRYGPVSSYFTPRDPTPVREFSDQLMIGETPDDSAFWHIEPDAFLTASEPTVFSRIEQKSGRASCETRRFL